MNLLTKIKDKLTVLIPEPVYYNEHLRMSFSSCSVAGDTLHGKTAVVTGGASGIGFSICQRLLDEGCNVIITGRNQQRLDECALQFRNERKCFIHTLQIDQLNPESVTFGCNKVFKLYPIDFWINCAGIITEIDRKRRFRGTTKEQFNKVIDTNYKSVYLMCNLVYNHMRKANGGKIVNIASMAGIIQSFGYTAYGISKKSVINLTKSFYCNKEDSVSVVAVAPGVVVTRMGDYRFGDNIANMYNDGRHTTIPEEIAALVCFILSPMGKYLSGTTIEASSNENLF